MSHGMTLELRQELAAVGHPQDRVDIEESVVGLGRGGSHGIVRRVVDRVLGEVVDQYGVTVRFEAHAGAVRAPQPDDRDLADLIVCAFATPIASGVRSTNLRAAYGNVLPRQSIGIRLLATGMGVPIIDDEANVLAEAIPADGEHPGYVYILFDLFREEFEGQTDVFRKIMKDAASIALGRGAGAFVVPVVPAREPLRDAGFVLPAPPPVTDLVLPAAPRSDIDELDAQRRWVAERAFHRNAHTANAGVPFDPLVTATDTAAAATVQALDGRVAALRKASDVYEGFTRKQGEAAAAAEVARERIALEYDAIRNMAKVADITITRDELTVRTGTLYTTEEDVTYDLGEWEIRIPRGQDPHDVRVFPQDRTRKSANGWYHPHVDANGIICFGSVSDHLGRALRESEYDVAVQFLIALLETGLGQQTEWTFHRGVLKAIGRVVPGNAVPAAVRPRQPRSPVAPPLPIPDPVEELPWDPFGDVDDNGDVA